MRTYQFCILRKPSDRLDKLLSRLFPNLTRTFVQHLILQKHVLVNKTPVSAHLKLKARDEVELKIPNLEQSGILPSNIPLDILYEDKDVLVINKQAGLVVHPSDNGGHMADSLVNALLFLRPDVWSIGGSKRPGIVHRLDKDTSGVLIVAKTDAAMQYLAKQWEKKTVYKEYVALLSGHLTPATGMIEAPLGRSSQDRKKIAVKVGSGSRYALTKYEVIEYLGNTTLVKVVIVTGRTHQIRAHFQAIHFPLIGDPVYGNLSANREYEEQFHLQRQFLHAQKLRVALPSTKKEMEFIAPLPRDLATILKNLRKKN